MITTPQYPRAERSWIPDLKRRQRGRTAVLSRKIGSGHEALWQNKCHSRYLPGSDRRLCGEEHHDENSVRGLPCE